MSGFSACGWLRMIGDERDANAASYTSAGGADVRLDDDDHRGLAQAAGS